MGKIINNDNGLVRKSQAIVRITDSSSGSQKPGINIEKQIPLAKRKLIIKKG